MGRMLGSHADDGMDRDDLNKCPDCGCFFASDNCPLCGKECPEHMRAGKRPAVKHKKGGRGDGYVLLLPWYYRWWFITLALLIFPLIGLVLLISSPLERRKKILAVVIAALYTLITSLGVGNIISRLSELWDEPVDTSLSQEEYIERCDEISLLQFYRNADEYEDTFVCLRVKIVERVTFIDKYYNEKDYAGYLCRAEDGSEFTVILRDCLQSGKQRFVPGDILTVYGEGAGEREVLDGEYTPITAPCLNMAYAVIETPTE